MARRRRSSRRRSRRNTRYATANRRRSRRNSMYPIANGRRRRRRGWLRPNLFGTDIVSGVAIPVIGGAVGFVAARALGNWLSMQGSLPLVGGSPKWGKTAAALAGVAGVMVLGRSQPMVRQHQLALMLGMGLAASESFLRDTVLLGGAPAAAALTPSEAVAAPSDAADTANRVAEGGGSATSGLSSYYTEGMLGLGDGVQRSIFWRERKRASVPGLHGGYDVSHAGAPYKGMLGLGEDPANQAHVDDAMDALENGTNGGTHAVSTVTPTDAVRRAHDWNWNEPVTEQFTSGSDGRGGAGGLFARNLFSGMMGG